MYYDLVFVKMYNDIWETLVVLRKFTYVVLNCKKNSYTEIQKLLNDHHNYTIFESGFQGEWVSINLNRRVLVKGLHLLGPVPNTKVYV